MQIALADLVSLCQIKFELFYVSYRSWMDQPEICPIYLGLDAFTNTAIIFFIITLNMHTVSTYNLALKTIARNAAKLLNEKQCEIAAIDDDADSDEAIQHQQRSIIIDYSKPKTRISVLMPIVFIWLLAASMSVPLFWYGHVLPSMNNSKICGLIQLNRNNNLLLQILLIKMRIVVPTVCLALSTIYVTFKLFSVKHTIQQCGLNEDVKQILKLALTLALTFILFSMQRIYGSLWFELISRPMMEYKYSQFDKWIGIGCCMLHYSAPTIRPIIYFYFEKNLWNDFKMCCRRRKT